MATTLPAPGRATQETSAAVRKSLLEKLQLADKKDVLIFSPAADMIEQFEQTLILPGESWQLRKSARATHR